MFSCLVPTHWSIPVLPHWLSYSLMMDNIISFGFTLYKHKHRPSSWLPGFVTYSRISSLRKFTLLRLGNRDMITYFVHRWFTALNPAIRTTRFSLPVIISVHFTLIMRRLRIIARYSLIEGKPNQQGPYTETFVGTSGVFPSRRTNWYLSSLRHNYNFRVFLYSDRH